MEAIRPDIEVLQQELLKSQRELDDLALIHVEGASEILKKHSELLVATGLYPKRIGEFIEQEAISRNEMHAISLGAIGDPEDQGAYGFYPEYFTRPDGSIFTCPSTIDGVLIIHKASSADIPTTIKGVNKAMEIIEQIYNIAKERPPVR